MSRNTHNFRRVFPAMAGDCEIVVEGTDETTANRLFDRAIAEVARIERKYSRYLPDSIVSRINAAAGRQAVECDEETKILLGYAGTLYQLSDGLFDITSGILRKAWDFEKAVVPTKAQMEPLLALVGWEEVERDGSSIRLPHAGMEIDFGGFGKEYAADRAATVLAAGGIKHGYVNMGGDIRVFGPKADGEPWLMGIKNPRAQGTIVATIPLSQGALATSGDYERYIEVDGKRYCHVLDPRTGYPVSYWQSVSVIAPLAVMAGSYTTIAMLKGKDALAFLEESGVAYLAIDQQGAIHNHSGQKPA